MIHFRSEFLGLFWNCVFVTLGLLLMLAEAGCRTASLPSPATEIATESPWSHSEILEHLRVLNSSDVADRATGPDAFALAADYLAYLMAQYKLQPVLHSDYRIMYPLPVSVETYGRPFVDGIDVMGYIGGKHPVLSRELVIVCADLDAMGPVGVAPATDLEQRGVAASALLEVARVQSRSAQAFSTPERTILFAVWPGGRLDHAGFRAYLNRPVWPLDATRAVIYIGLRKSDSARLRGVLSSHGVDLYAVSPADSLVQDQAVMSAPVPNPTASAPAGAQAEGGDDLSRAMDQASLAAERMAREANDLLVSLAASPVPLPSEPSGRPPSRVRVDGH